MRLFLAIDLSQEIRFRLDRLLAALRPEALISWSPLDNLHITTKFIGNWPEEKLAELHQSILALSPREPFEIRLGDLGWFPNRRAPRVLWAGVDGGESLFSLARETEDRLSMLGIKREDRPFSPHLTLARIRNTVPLSRLREKVDEMKSVSIGTYHVSGFTLYRSDPGSTASLYRKLHEYHFQTALAASARQ